MQTNCEAEAITSIYSPSVLWLSSYTSRRCSPALWRGEEAGAWWWWRRWRWCGGGGKRGQHPTKGWEGTVGGKDAGHSVIQRVVSPRSAAGRGFTAKREKKKKNKSCWYIKGIWNKKGCFMKIAHRKCQFQLCLGLLKEPTVGINTHTHTHSQVHIDTLKRLTGHSEDLDVTGMLWKVNPPKLSLLTFFLLLLRKLFTAWHKNSRYKIKSSSKYKLLKCYKSEDEGTSRKKLSLASENKKCLIVCLRWYIILLFVTTTYTKTIYLKLCSMRITVCGGGLGSSTVCLLVAPGCPHASPHPRRAVPALDRWVGGGEGHYHDGGGERGGVRLKMRKQEFPSRAASPLFPLNHCSNTHCLLQHMLLVVKTELDARAPPPLSHPPALILSS